MPRPEPARSQPLPRPAKWQPDGLLNRRGLLAGAVAGSLAALAACSPDPTVHGSRTPGTSPTTTPDSTPTVAAAQAALAGAETEFAAWLRALAARATALKAPGPARVWLLAGADQCTEHAAWLSSPNPLHRPGSSATPASGSPSPNSPASPGTGKPPADWTAATKELARRADALSVRHQQAALQATDPSLVLLYASLAVAAHSLRQLGPLPVAGKVQPAEVEVGTAAEAQLVLLSRLRALVQGLQVGIGQLPLPDPRYAPARQRLVEVMGRRDQVMAALVAAKVPVPPAELSYAMPGGLDKPSDIVTTWGRLESGVLDAWARVAAATTGSSRKQAFTEMIGQADRVRSRGVALGRWPGWA